VVLKRPEPGVHVEGVLKPGTGGIVVTVSSLAGELMALTAEGHAPGGEAAHPFG
jgi:hypothetical protein